MNSKKKKKTNDTTESIINIYGQFTNKNNNNERIVMCPLFYTSCSRKTFQSCRLLS